MIFQVMKLDRSSYPLAAQVHLTISDNQLNIDPTDEDIWTFDADGSATYYGSVTTNNQKILTTMQNHGYVDNGVLTINPNAQWC